MAMNGATTTTMTGSARSSSFNGNGNVQRNNRMNSVDKSLAKKSNVRTLAFMLWLVAVFAFCQLMAVWKMTSLSKLSITSSALHQFRLLSAAPAETRKPRQGRPRKTARISLRKTRKNKTFARPDRHYDSMKITTQAAGMTIRYIYPSIFSTIRHAVQSGEQSPSLLIGALSSASNAGRRQLIRHTWGRSHNVVFLVAGDWNKVSAEYDAYGDLLWLEKEELYEFLNLKTLVFFDAAEHVLGSQHYSYLLKTDDDSYVHVQQVEQELSTSKPEYWGRCFHGSQPIRNPREKKWYISKEEYAGDFFPPYGTGCGYALSPTFAACAVKEMVTVMDMPWEDVTVGLLADRCRVSCVGTPAVNNHKLAESIVQRHVKAENGDMHLYTMRQVHKRKYPKLGWADFEQSLLSVSTTNENALVLSTESEKTSKVVSSTSSSSSRNNNNNMFSFFVQRPSIIHNEADSTTIPETAFFAGREIHFRYPHDLQNATQAVPSKTVIGVLSASGNVHRRMAIRNSWGRRDDGQRRENILFVVGGTWADVAREANMFGDVLWVDVGVDHDMDMDEMSGHHQGRNAAHVAAGHGESRSSFATYKSLVLQWVVDKHVKSYQYVFKTEDDAYVNVEEVEAILAANHPAYWGRCIAFSRPVRDPQNEYYVSYQSYPHEHYPIYASGVGYALSLKFNKCALEEATKMTPFTLAGREAIFTEKLEVQMDSSMEGDFLPPEDDVFTGILADRCGMVCNDDSRVNPLERKLYTIQHYVKDDLDMLTLHKLVKNAEKK